MVPMFPVCQRMTRKFMLYMKSNENSAVAMLAMVTSNLGFTKGINNMDTETVLRNLESILTMDSADIERIRQVVRDTWDIVLALNPQPELTDDQCTQLDHAYDAIMSAYHDDR